MYHHGAPTTFSADPQFCQTVMKKFLISHGIELLQKPPKSSSKDGKIERKNGIFNEVLSRISRESTTASPRFLVSTASFLTNTFHGKSVLDSFQLAIGYAFSFLGLPSPEIPNDLMEAHRHFCATRAIQKLRKSHDRHLVPCSSLPSGTSVSAF